MIYTYGKYLCIVVTVGVFFLPPTYAQDIIFKAHYFDFSANPAKKRSVGYFSSNRDTSEIQSTITYKKSLSERDTLPLSKRRIMLEEVRVFAKPKFKEDSLAFREEYKKIFNYQPEKFKFSDLFINKSSQSYNSTASLVSINLLGLVALIGKNKDRNMELKSKFLKYEKDRSLDNKFSKAYFENITNLEGDSLDMFIKEYKWKLYIIEDNEYEQILFIKESLKKFKKAE